jgi:hypothetical protein
VSRLDLNQREFEGSRGRRSGNPRDCAVCDCRRPIMEPPERAPAGTKVGLQPTNHWPNFPSDHFLITVKCKLFRRRIEGFIAKMAQTSAAAAELLLYQAAPMNLGKTATP